MGFGGRRVLALVFPLAALAGCHVASGAPPVNRAAVALPSYAPPSETPGFCASLAGTTHVVGLPFALGTLAARPEDVGAKVQLTGAVEELQGVLDQVSDQPDDRALATSLEDLLAALREARDAGLTDEVRAEISAGLDDVGRRAQPACGFPS